MILRNATHLFRYTPKVLYFDSRQLENPLIPSLITRFMKHGYHVTLNSRLGVIASDTALEAGSGAAAQALSAFDAVMMRRLQPLAARPRSELAGTDYLDASVLDYALSKALEAAFPETVGEPPAPLTRESFVLCITEENPGAVVGVLVEAEKVA
jgi:hypothetical protein